MNTDDNKAKMWVHRDFDKSIRTGHARMNAYLINKYGKGISLLDYTKYMADFLGEDMVTKASLGTIMPIKKGRKSKKVSLDFNRVFLH